MGQQKKSCMEISILNLSTNTLQNLYALFKSFLRGFFYSLCPFELRREHYRRKVIVQAHQYSSLRRSATGRSSERVPHSRDVGNNVKPLSRTQVDLATAAT